MSLVVRIVSVCVLWACVQVPRLAWADELPAREQVRFVDGRLVRETVREAYEPKYTDAFDMRYGLFIHWVGCSPTQDSMLKYPDGASIGVGKINEYAAAIDVEKVADEIEKLGFEYVIITDFHGFGTMLHPSKASDKWRGKGFAADRDVIGEMILALKKRGIGFILFTHPICGHIYPDRDKLGWNEPTGFFKKWNDFINDVYAELAERYGKDMMGIGFDGMFGLGGGGDFEHKLDRVRLRKTILERAPHLQLYGLAGPNQTAEFNHKEVWRPSWHVPHSKLEDDDYDTENWPSYQWVVSAVQGHHWAAIVAAKDGEARCDADGLYRYSVLQAATANEGPGNAWAASPYPDGTWEKDVGEVFARVAESMAPIRPSLTRVYPSFAWRTREAQLISRLEHGIVATRSIDDRIEYVHVLNPPRGKTLNLPPPANGKRFLHAALLADGTPVGLTQTGDGVALVLGEDSEWDRLDTVIALDVDPASIPRRNLAFHAKVEASDTSFQPRWPPHVNRFAMVRLVDGIRHVEKATTGRLPDNYGWSSDVNRNMAPRWVSVDMGEAHDISEVHLYPRDDEGNEGFGIPRRLQIETSSDGKAWQEVAVRNDIQPGAEPLVFIFDAVEARYVRVTGSDHRPEPALGFAAMQFVELEVYGEDE